MNWDAIGAIGEIIGALAVVISLVYLTVALRSFEDAYFQWREGRLESEIWRALLTPLVDLKSTSAFNRFWSIRRHHFRPEFADYLDSLEAGNYSF